MDANERSAQHQLLLVLSIEKTGGQAVRQSLRAAAERHGLDCKVHHVHFLDGRPYRDPEGGEARVNQIKEQREDHIAKALSKKTVRTTIFTIRRDPLSRFMSALWHDHHETLSRGVDTIFVKGKLRDAVQLILAKENAYPFHVYKQLGLPRDPAFGKHVTRRGRTAYVLDFANLAESFASATADFFGEPAPLLRVNTGDRRGEPGAYDAFKAAFMADPRCMELLQHVLHNEQNKSQLSVETEPGNRVDDDAIASS